MHHWLRRGWTPLKQLTKVEKCSCNQCTQYYFYYFISLFAVSKSRFPGVVYSNKSEFLLNTSLEQLESQCNDCLRSIGYTNRCCLGKSKHCQEKWAKFIWKILSLIYSVVDSRIDSGIDLFIYLFNQSLFHSFIQ